MRYITYERDSSGIVARTHRRLTLTALDRAAQYPHRERTINGWPERSIYWNKPGQGTALGVAPVAR